MPERRRRRARDAHRAGAGRHRARAGSATSTPTATGTQANDPTETRAIRAVFGSHADALAVSVDQGYARATRWVPAARSKLIAAVGALRDGVVPPTINYLGPDPDCDLNVVPNTAQERQVECGAVETASPSAGSTPSSR
jgi:3-oxoacyl-(acyl-carrier-protein) synthase